MVKLLYLIKIINSFLKEIIIKIKNMGKVNIVLKKMNYVGEFFDDKMEGKGTYHYENGDVWEGFFKNNLKNGVGIMNYHISNDVFI